MILVRQAIGTDVSQIRDLFLSAYAESYPYAHYYDEAALTKMVFSDGNLILVAEDTESGRLVGSASVILSVGANSDLVGEFGRLVVRPEARHQGVGTRLMEERIQRVQDRLHVGLVEARVAHPYSMRIAEAHNFSAVGWLPLKMLIGEREHLSLYARYFGHGLELRRNHPRIVPEVYSLAHLGLENCRLSPDAIVDEDSPPYPPGGEFALQELTTEGYAALLRIERGRVRHREIFGPVRLHYGIFQLTARHSRYLIAREQGRIVGAVGFIVDPVEKVVRIFELIAAQDSVVRFILGELERRYQDELSACYVEVDVSAYAPRMQRTLVELGFLPAAYIPALVFHDVERLDVVKMVRLLRAVGPIPETLTPRARSIAELVLRQLATQSILPRIADAVERLPLFNDLSREQVTRLACMCRVETFENGEIIFREGEPSRALYVVLEGKVLVSIASAAAPLGMVTEGECLGETSLLTASTHSATAIAATRIEAAVMNHRDLAELMRMRPDIGLFIYRALAIGLSEKLKRFDKHQGSASKLRGVSSS